uniref:Reverse transcriptase domain-containing protein n=1 Tax=Nothobranchius furzeri TaxID=105023 RepID=A0A8C6KDR5_NOTFU
MFRSSFHPKKLTIPVTPTSFEFIAFEVDFSPPLLFILCYRPPKYNSNFLSKFSDLLTAFLPKYDRGIILGDFIIHVCCPDKHLVGGILDILDCFGLQQQVQSPTHSGSHILDLVLSFGICIFDLIVDSACISNHSPIIFNICGLTPPSTRQHNQHLTRIISPFTTNLLASSLATTLSTSQPDSTYVGVEELLTSFNSTCSTVLNAVAPLKSRHKKTVADPWLNEETHALRCQCRVCERRWRKDKWQISYQLFKDSLTRYQKAVRTARNRYFANIITRHKNDQKKLYSVLTSALSLRESPNSSPSTGALCNEFQNFFLHKIQEIRTGFSYSGWVTCVEPHCPPSFSCFAHVTLSSLVDLILAMKPSGSPEDSLPPRLLHNVLPEVAPAVLDIVNSSFSSGVFPAAFKNAVVQPLLKKPGLDQSDCANYHPISKLPFISKVAEKLAIMQLNSHLDDNRLLDPFQSGFRRNYSTESAHIRVLNVILILTDSGSHVLLLLLDLIVAFNTVDLTILLHRLEFWVGVTSTALEWFKPYLNGRCFSVHVGDCSSPNAPLPWGVPQGSILGPLVFSIYILPLGKILANLGVNYHFYADDCQIYLQINQQHSFSIMSECLSQVRYWLSQNCLKLNDSKSDAILFSPTNINGALDVSTLPLNLKSCATSLDVKLDSDLSMSSQVKATVKSCFFQLRRVTRLKSILKCPDLE